jgi:hypothetical protein
MAELYEITKDRVFQLQLPPPGGRSGSQLLRIVPPARGTAGNRARPPFSAGPAVLRAAFRATPRSFGPSRSTPSATAASTSTAGSSTSCCGPAAHPGHRGGGGLLATAGGRPGGRPRGRRRRSQDPDRGDAHGLVGRRSDELVVWGAEARREENGAEPRALVHQALAFLRGCLDGCRKASPAVESAP